ncbi:transglycosylase SLT domain-containing protein [Kribbella sp. VKM Ac-2566]|uniref:transglycosylase SLT domain-containing protein n=1 Tax=Kribbella sp. VKM Ac-2566 TaxID=2512218 RepID=UPI001062EFDF|nr:transglycosylase SLT domain-containing protein [Kribbella sp. VKM Ac-2566]TDW86579.1 transglycosylase-like protein with SLT domain [Kribbella sp. VKM Ac-2566]
MAKRWAWVAVGVLVAGVWAACSDDNNDNADKPASTPKHSTATKPSTTKPPTKPTATSTKPWYDDYDPAHFASDVRRYAKQAGINPQLLMAILYNESYKPHDPKFERQWAEVDSDPAFGIANMHKPAFDETKRGRDFAKRKWEELPDNPALAIQAAAWHLHDLAKRLPSKRADLYTKDELLALGYNAGGGNMRIFARGRKAGSQAQSYVDRLHDNWAKSAEALKS